MEHGLRGNHGFPQILLIYLRGSGRSVISAFYSRMEGLVHDKTNRNRTLNRNRNCNRKSNRIRNRKRDRNRVRSRKRNRIRNRSTVVGIDNAIVIAAARAIVIVTAIQRRRNRYRPRRRMYGSRE